MNYTAMSSQVGQVLKLIADYPKQQSEDVCVSLLLDHCVREQ